MKKGLPSLLVGIDNLEMAFLESYYLIMFQYVDFDIKRINGEKISNFMLKLIIIYVFLFL
ncbi:hypothetical protein YDYSY3_31870 [Paenibacillus chitinolyticus]|nr:hypothetical protein YDYSY3_31870 [Paenibacillus chitinolyticus]